MGTAIGSLDGQTFRSPGERLDGHGGNEEARGPAPDEVPDPRSGGRVRSLRTIPVLPPGTVVRFDRLTKYALVDRRIEEAPGIILQKRS